MFWTVTLALLESFGNSLRLFFATLAVSLPLGLLVCFGCMQRGAARGQNPSVRRGSRADGLSVLLRGLVGLMCRCLVWVVRGTPLMLQLLIVFYAPGLLFNLPLMERFQAALVAFGVNYACYFAEIYRGGIETIPKGQSEAGQVLGMTRGQIFLRVTLLQMIRRILPAMGNEFITLVKDTSLARVIAVYEIIWRAESYTKSAGIIWPLFYTMVFYLVATGALTLLFGFFERRLDHLV